MIAVVVVRAGSLPAGGAEAVAECDGRAVLIGSETALAVDALKGIATELSLIEFQFFQPAAIAEVLAAVLDSEPRVLLPASPDGRDLAPRLAFSLRRPLYTGATLVRTDRIDAVRHHGRELHRMVPAPKFVATLEPGVRGVLVDPAAPEPTIEMITPSPSATPTNDVSVVAVHPPDPATIDLAEAGIILGGGGGLDAPRRLEQLAAIGAKIGASVGATRVVTDRGWAAHERQIGTTGVVVSPRAYLAFGVAGAVQHTSGLGDPQHIVSVNTDPHCPMMQLADIAIVADANQTIDALTELLA